MWTFTKYGFFSIVLDATDHGQVAIRARAVKDLEGLKAAFPALLGAAEIKLTPHRDYYARLRISRPEHVALAAALAADLDYDDFKTHLKRTHSQDDKLDILNDLWGTMNRYQGKQHPGMGAYVPTPYTGLGRYGYSPAPKPRPARKARKARPQPGATQHTTAQAFVESQSRNGYGVGLVDAAGRILAPYVDPDDFVGLAWATVATGPGSPHGTILTGHYQGHQLVLHSGCLEEEFDAQAPAPDQTRLTF